MSQPVNRWELVSHDDSSGVSNTYRMAVPDGWLYRHHSHHGALMRESMVFVPEPSRPRSAPVDVQVGRKRREWNE